MQDTHLISYLRVHEHVDRQHVVELLSIDHVRYDKCLASVRLATTVLDADHSIIEFLKADPFVTGEDVMAKFCISRSDYTHYLDLQRSLQKSIVFAYVTENNSVGRSELMDRFALTQVVARTLLREYRSLHPHRAGGSC